VSAERGRGRQVLTAGRTCKADVHVDLTDSACVAAELGKHDVSCIIHAAAAVPATGAEYGDEVAAADSVQMTQNIAAAAQQRDIPVILISSMTVYPADVINPVSEDASSGIPSSAYADGKRQAEQILTGMGITGFAARIPGLYGGSRQSGIVAGLKTAMRNDASPRLPDAPIQWAAMSVTDAACSILRLIGKTNSSFVPVNIGYAGPMSINRLVSIAADIYGRQVTSNVRHPDFEYDLTRWSTLTNEAPKSFEKAIRDYMR